MNYNYLYKRLKKINKKLDFLYEKSTFEDYQKTGRELDLILKKIEYKRLKNKRKAI